MNPFIRSLLAVAAIITLIGCASTTIFPEGNGIYSLVTTSGDQGYAESDAEKKAADYCTKLGKQLVVVSHTTAYHGADKNNVAFIGLASAVFSQNGGNPARSNSDYEVTMKFKCQ